jgi:hypothetical protein
MRWRGLLILVFLGINCGPNRLVQDLHKHPLSCVGLCLHGESSDPGAPRLGVIDRSPEKTGVGGSTPSRGTIFSIAYKYAQPRVCSILFQNQNPGSSRFVSNPKYVAIDARRVPWKPRCRWPVRQLSKSTIRGTLLACINCPAWAPFVSVTANREDGLIERDGDHFFQAFERHPLTQMRTRRCTQCPLQCRRR